MSNKLLRDQLLKDMESSVGTKDPLVYFKNMTLLFKFLFEELDSLSQENEMLKTMTALAIKWEPTVARDMLDAQVNRLRESKDVYHAEISDFKKARMEDSVTQNYDSFCKFWEDTLGYHPFIDYK
jgi:hypothetical protein